MIVVRAAKINKFVKLEYFMKKSKPEITATIRALQTTSSERRIEISAEIKKNRADRRKREERKQNKKKNYQKSRRDL